MSNCRMGRSVLFFLFLSVFAFLPVAFAQSTDSLPPIEKKRSNSLKPGAWALQFQITQDFTLNAFQGALVSSKVHFSRKTAVRFGVGVNASMLDGENTNRSLQGDTLKQETNRDNESNSQGFDLNLQYLVYPSPEARVSVFLGAGPFFRFSHSNSESRGIDELYDTVITTYQFIYETESDRWSTGISGLLGAEWFATSSLSLHAEYGFFFDYGRDTYSNRSTRRLSTGEVQTSESESKQNSFKFGQGPVKFGLSVYF